MAKRSILLLINIIINTNLCYQKQYNPVITLAKILVMKNLFVLLLLAFSVSHVNGQNLSPYILAFESSDNISEVKSVLKTNLKSNGIDVVGEYQPADDSSRWVICISSSELIDAVTKTGGLTGFAAALRIGITVENDTTLVSYTNPGYWGNAYFRKDFDSVADNYKKLTTKIEAAMKASGSYIGSPFGSKKGKSVDNLRNYKYKFMMPHFDDTKKLEKFDTYEAAIAKIESSIENGTKDVTKVYRVDIPGKNLTVYGFGLSGKDGETKFMPKIDINKPKHTAFLPYEILVKDNEVHMLHGRFRIALSFPDLSMGTFTKIMSTPGNIEGLMKRLVKDEE